MWNRDNYHGSDFGRQPYNQEALSARYQQKSADPWVRSPWQNPQLLLGGVQNQQLSSVNSQNLPFVPNSDIPRGNMLNTNMLAANISKQNSYSSLPASNFPEREFSVSNTSFSRDLKSFPEGLRLSQREILSSSMKYNTNPVEDRGNISQLSRYKSYNESLSMVNNMPRTGVQNSGTNIREIFDYSDKVSGSFNNAAEKSFNFPFQNRPNFSNRQFQDYKRYPAIYERDTRESFKSFNVPNQDSLTRMTSKDPNTSLEYDKYSSSNESNFNQMPISSSSAVSSSVPVCEPTKDDISRMDSLSNVSHHSAETLEEHQSQLSDCDILQSSNIGGGSTTFSEKTSFHNSNVVQEISEAVKESFMPSQKFPCSDAVFSSAVSSEIRDHAVNSSESDKNVSAPSAADTDHNSVRCTSSLSMSSDTEPLCHEKSIPEVAACPPTLEIHQDITEQSSFSSGIPFLDESKDISEHKSFSFNESSNLSENSSSVTFGNSLFPVNKVGQDESESRNSFFEKSQIFKEQSDSTGKIENTKIDIKDTCAGQSSLVKIIESATEPVVGLEFIIEYKKFEASSSSSLPFRCTLCNASMTSDTSTFSHVIGHKHRMRYLKRKDEEEYERIFRLPKKKSERNPDLEQAIAALEKQFGHGTIKVEYGSSKISVEIPENKSLPKHPELQDENALTTVEKLSTSTSEAPVTPGSDILNFIGDAKVLSDILSAAKSFNTNETSTDANNDSVDQKLPNVEKQSNQLNNSSSSSCYTLPCPPLPPSLSKSSVEQSTVYTSDGDNTATSYSGIQYTESKSHVDATTKADLKPNQSLNRSFSLENKFQYNTPYSHYNTSFQGEELSNKNSKTSDPFQYKENTESFRNDPEVDELKKYYSFSSDSVSASARKTHYGHSQKRPSQDTFSSEAFEPFKKFKVDTDETAVNVRQNSYSIPGLSPEHSENVPSSDVQYSYSNFSNFPYSSCLSTSVSNNCEFDENVYESRQSTQDYISSQPVYSNSQIPTNLSVSSEQKTTECKQSAFVDSCDATSDKSKEDTKCPTFENDSHSFVDTKTEEDHVPPPDLSLRSSTPLPTAAADLADTSHTDLKTSLFSALGGCCISNEADANTVLQVVTVLMDAYLQFKLQSYPVSLREFLIMCLCKGEQTGIGATLKLLSVKDNNPSALDSLLSEFGIKHDANSDKFFIAESPDSLVEQNNDNYVDSSVKDQYEPATSIHENNCMSYQENFVYSSTTEASVVKITENTSLSGNIMNSSVAVSSNQSVVYSNPATSNVASSVSYLQPSSVMSPVVSASMSVLPSQSQISMYPTWPGTQHASVTPMQQLMNYNYWMSQNMSLPAASAVPANQDISNIWPQARAISNFSVAPPSVTQSVASTTTPQPLTQPPLPPQIPVVQPAVSASQVLPSSFSGMQPPLPPSQITSLTSNYATAAPLPPPLPSQVPISQPPLPPTKFHKMPLPPLPPSKPLSRPPPPPPTYTSHFSVAQVPLPPMPPQ